jgi:hypothetical protein
MNPCIDCRIYTLRKPKDIADEMGAKFIFTGESIGQGPADRHRKAFELIEREAGLEGKVLRPLSARLLPETEAERMGWVDRGALTSISIRSRRQQMPPVKIDDGIDYPCRAGGCLLTDLNFAARLDDFLVNGAGSLALKDVNLLKLGRHFRVDGYKVVIGRDRAENAKLITLASDDFIILSPASVPGPVGILENNGTGSLDTVASMVARYCDSGGKKVQLKVSSAFGGGTLEAEPMPLTELKRYRIGGRGCGTSRHLESQAHMI